MKIFAVADIHGCYDELMALYKQLPINPEKDMMVFCGDHIDRGPKSRQVVEQLMEWKEKYPHWQVVYGNHEDLMLDALLYKGRKYNSFDLWFEQGGRETFQSYLPDELQKKNLSEEERYQRTLLGPRDVIPEEHLAFLATCPRYFTTDKYVFVHGGLRPGIAIEDQKESDLIWIRDEFIDSKYDWGKKVIFGHTCDSDGRHNPKGGKFTPIRKKNKIGIDTAVCQPTQNGLTCVELPKEKFYFQSSFKNNT